MSVSDSSSGPTIRKMMVGAELRRLREKAGMSREDAGYHIRGSASKISRMELGRVSFKERDIADLLTYYGLSDDNERTTLVTLAREANEPGWWHAHDQAIPEWVATYVGLEDSATILRIYAPHIIHGLLQTREYAHAVVSSLIPSVPDGAVGEVVDVKMKRQRILDREDPPMLWVILDEATLARPTGGRAVMRRQIEHLIAMSERPSVTIQLKPLRLGSHVSAGGEFTLFRFGEPEVPDIVFIEELTTALYLDKTEQVSKYTEVMERLSVDSLSPSETVERLSAIAKSA